MSLLSITSSFAGKAMSSASGPVKSRERDLPAVRQAVAGASQMKMQYRTAHIPWPFICSDHLPFRLKGYSNAVTLSLLPAGQIPALEGLMSSVNLRDLLAGRRSTLPEPLCCMHSSEDTSARLSERSLRSMELLLLNLIHQSDIS